MKRISINLPAKRVLSITLVKSKIRSSEKPLFPRLGELGRVKKGSKLSRYFRHVFEHTHIRRFLGTNLAVLVVATSFLPSASPLAAGEYAESSHIQSPVVLKTNLSYDFPVKSVKITQGYKFYHPGIDFDGETGDEIYPIFEGVVEEVGYSTLGYGNAIIIRHEDGKTSLYAHLSKTNVQVGDTVNQNTVIGLMGATGRSFGDHLHLEVREGGITPINPLNLFYSLD